MIKRIIQRLKIKTAIDAFIYSQENPKYLKGKVLKILLTNTKLAQDILESNYDILSRKQRLNIIKGLTDFYAYETLDRMENLKSYDNMYEHMMIIHIILNGPQDLAYGIGKNDRWVYIHAFVCRPRLLTPYEITKYTDYLIKHDIKKYMLNFYELVEEYYAKFSDEDNSWWVNNDAPRLEPYIIMQKLV